MFLKKEHVEYNVEILIVWGATEDKMSFRKQMFDRLEFGMSTSILENYRGIESLIIKGAISKTLTHWMYVDTKSLVNILY